MFLWKKKSNNHKFFETYVKVIYKLKRNISKKTTF